MGECRLDESQKQRMCSIGLRFELGVKLHGQKPGMVDQLDDFHQAAVRADSRVPHAPFHELLAILGIEFIAVSMPLGDALCVVTLGGSRPGFEQESRFGSHAFAAFARGAKSPISLALRYAASIT